LQVQVAINKTNKFGQSTGGDTAEIVERPRGGISLIVVDGQGSGRGAKRISSLVVNKAAALIGEGTRDGAVARAVHDYLYTMRYGKVSATLTIISVDMVSKTLLITRNSNTPVIVCNPDGETELLNKDVRPIGVHPLLRPHIKQFELEEGLRIASFSDGIFNAGSGPDETLPKVEQKLNEREIPLQRVGENIFQDILTLEKRRPRDDMTLGLLGLEPLAKESRVRSFFLSFPV